MLQMACTENKGRDFGEFFFQMIALEEDDGSAGLTSPRAEWPWASLLTRDPLPPLDHTPVKQTFSGEDSEPLKTVSFPGASEVPLDPVVCAREVHTEAFLHAIRQVLDDTHTLPLGSCSLSKVFKKTKIYPKNWAPAALFFPPPTTPPKYWEDSQKRYPVLFPAGSVFPENS